MNLFNEDEFRDICEKFNKDALVKEVAIKYNNKKYFNKIKYKIATDRRGEVVFCVKRPNGKYITVRSEDYPKGIFRIPTGGINYGEDIVDAVFREVKEELGLKVKIITFIGVIKFNIKYEEQQVFFYSYLFVLKEVSGRLLVDSYDHEVCEVKEVDVDGLFDVSNRLKILEGSWTDWAAFRLNTTLIFAEYLKSI